MNKPSKNIILILVVVVVLVAAGLYVIISTNSHAVPDGVIGNTPGNLNNKGLFCEEDGVVYFSNAYDMNTLYSMNIDGSNLKKLCDISVEYINVGGEYVFFYGEPNKLTSGIGSVVSKPGMYRIGKNGKGLKAMSKDISRDMVLVGNKMYYQHYDEKRGTTFAVMDLKKQESTELLDYMINPSCYYQGAIYFNGMYKDHYLHRYDIESATDSVIWEGDIWNPIYDGNFVYYMDVMNDYRLCRYSIPSNTIEVLTNERLDSFNLYNDIIYYQVSSSKEPALKRMRLDGSAVETVAYGVYSDINITSAYVYFKAFGMDVPIYMTPTYGPVNVSELSVARDAVMMNLN